MNPLSIWRNEIRLLVPRGFLRRDQGPGLLISDFPRFGRGEEDAERLRAAGYRVDAVGDLARVDGTKEKYEALLSLLPPAAPEPTDETLFLHALGQRLEKAAAPFSPEQTNLLRQALKWIDAGDAAALLRLLSPAAALAQRKGASLPGGLGRMVLCFLDTRRE